MSEESKLPSAMQKTKDELSKEEQEKKELPVKEQPEENKPEPSTEDKKEEAKEVTISREEFNQLQNASDRVRSAEGRAESLKLDLEALERRLTDIERGAKDRQEPSLPSEKPSRQFNQAEYTEDEKEEYGDSIPLIEKVAANKIGKILGDILPEIDNRLKAIEEKAENATNVVNNTRTGVFTDKVKQAVGNFNECVSDKNWPAFLESIEPRSGENFAELIAKNVQRENMDGMVDIFKLFTERYGLNEDKGSSYQGAEPSGVTATPTDAGQKVLKFSDRKKIHKQFINKEIDYEEYKKLKDQFDLADAEGRIDYDL